MASMIYFQTEDGATVGQWRVCRGHLTTVRGHVVQVQGKFFGVLAIHVVKELGKDPYGKVAVVVPLDMGRNTYAT